MLPFVAMRNVPPKANTRPNSSRGFGQRRTRTHTMSMMTTRPRRSRTVPVPAFV